MSRRFVVTAVEGDTEVTTFSDPGPVFLGVMVSAANDSGESIQFRRSLDEQPHVGEVVTFDEVPSSAIYQVER